MNSITIHEITHVNYDHETEAVWYVALDGHVVVGSACRTKADLLDMLVERGLVAAV